MQAATIAAFGRGDVLKFDEVPPTLLAQRPYPPA